MILFYLRASGIKMIILNKRALLKCIECDNVYIIYKYMIIC